MIGKFGKLFNQMEYYALITALSVMVIVIFSQVVMRYVFNNSLSWSEEFARYLFVWFSWMGVSAGVKGKEHLKVELLAEALGKRGFLNAKEVLSIIVSLVWLVTTLIVAYYGIQVVQMQMKLSVVTPAMRMPVWIGYLSVPACSIVVGIRLVATIVDSVKKLLGYDNTGLPGGESEVES
ncbi:TRAP transporter small permease [Anoxynatronum buryatiense]|uniref:TRAP-type C4-dicarboxylate transport system, small permease component n=1 Tax=Anoxynatronum buryatiense TaxID=489973 RepID=A0AA45WVD2_9CLOT|nr:TRAP transporter small permease [Anoxynatronum buryatiense]SMP53313.1 TRAP-type C4-dicarboxylate transport system, small permease component [Anoxynatronum buryatiense]